MLSEWLLFLHVISAVVYVGGAVVVTVQALGVGADAGPFLRFEKPAGRAIGAGAVATLLTGLALVIESDVWEFSMFFVWFGVAAIVVSGAIDGMYTRRRTREAEAAVERGDTGDARSTIRRVATVNLAVLAVFVVVVWAMVFKTGG